MKTVQITKNAKQKITNDKNKFKQFDLEKKPTQMSKVDRAPVESARPGSCPGGWVPKRDWHEYLSHLNPSAVSPSPSTSCVHETPPGDFQLPSVYLCSPKGCPAPARPAPSITDLCDEDKGKIAALVEELARCKDEKCQDEERILKLKSKVTKLKSSVKSLQAEKARTENRSLALVQSQHLAEQAALKEQLGELKGLLFRMEQQKTASEDQARRISEQAAKLTQAVHALHRENTGLKVELADTRERLTAAHQLVERMTRDLEDVKDRIRPLPSEDKACQSTEDLGGERVHLKPMEETTNLPIDHQLLSEIFFNNSMKENCVSKETIIFLPAGTYLPPYGPR